MKHYEKSQKELVKYWIDKSKKLFNKYDLLLLTYTYDKAIFLNDEHDEHITIYKNNNCEFKDI